MGFVQHSRADPMTFFGPTPNMCTGLLNLNVYKVIIMTNDHIPKQSQSSGGQPPRAIPLDRPSATEYRLIVYVAYTIFFHKTACGKPTAVNKTPNVYVMAMAHIGLY